MNEMLLSQTSSYLVCTCYRSLFMEEGGTEGERPMSTQAAVLLYGWRSNHPLWWNQVRLKIILKLPFCVYTL